MKIFQKWMRSWLFHLTGWVLGRPRLVLIIGILATVGGAWITALRLGISNDPNALIREDSAAHRYWKEYRRWFAMKDPFVVVIQSPEFELNVLAAEAVVARLRRMDGAFTQVLYKTDLNVLRPHLLKLGMEEMGGGLDVDALLRQVEQVKLNVNEQLAELAEFRQLLTNLKQQRRQFDFNAVLDRALQDFRRLETEQGAYLEGFARGANEFIQQIEALAQALSQPVPQQNLPESTPGTDLAQVGAGMPATGEETAFSMAQVEDELNRRSYSAFDEGRVLLVLGVPADGSGETWSAYEGLIKKVRTELEKVEAELPGVTIGLTGEPVLMDDELRQSTEDAVIAGLVTFLAISVLFFLAYREITRPLLAIAALLCAMVWTLGVTSLTIGHLNLISQAVIVMILGLGIDFGIQLIGRYEEELAIGKDVRQALLKANSQTGAAVLTGGSITAIAFFTMCFNDFIGLAELGWIAGVGTLLAMGAALVLLPAMMVWRDGHLSAEKIKGVRAASWGERVDQSLVRYPRALLGLAGAFTVVMAGGIPRIEFDFNLLNLNNQRLESVQLARELAESDAFSFIYGVVLASSLEEARSRAEMLRQMPEVREVQSLADLIPPEDLQRQRMEKFRSLRETLAALDLSRLQQAAQDVAALAEDLERLAGQSTGVDVVRARSNLREMLEFSREALVEVNKVRQVRDARVRLAHEVFSRLVPALERALRMFESLSQEEVARRLNRFDREFVAQLKSRIRLQSAEFGQLGLLELLREQNLERPVGIEDLPEDLRSFFVSKLTDQGKRLYLVKVDPAENIWDGPANERFVQALRQVSAEATGTPVQNYVYINLLRRSYLEASQWAFLVIGLLVVIHFAHLGRVIYTMVPLVIGMVWSLGAIGWLGIFFNPANIITLPMIIGIGVAFGVYVVDRYVEEGRVAVFSGSTGKAIFLSALTTMLGFASLTLGQHQGIVSMGVVMVLGVGGCFLATVLVLPPLLRIDEKRRACRRQKMALH